MQVTSLLSQSSGASVDVPSSRGAVLMAMVGAALLGLPLLVNSARSLRRGEVGINNLALRFGPVVLRDQNRWEGEHGRAERLQSVPS